jgi:hypothetical protein
VQYQPPPLNRTKKKLEPLNLNVAVPMPYISSSTCL